MRGLEVGRYRKTGPGIKKKNGQTGGGWMRWRSIMITVCYDVLNQVLFDKTVLSTCVFIVSPVSPSTKAGWWYVSVLVHWGVWGSALQWPVHPSGPRAEVVQGYWIRAVVNLSLRMVSQAKSNIPLHYFLDQSYSNAEIRLKTTSSREKEQIFNEVSVCVISGYLFKPVERWHVWFFPAVPLWRGCTPGIPLITTGLNGMSHWLV